jgi:hypothetical protein
MANLDSIAQQGGFALLAAVCVWAIVAVVKIGVTQMERGHLREIEALKTLASDRAELLRQALDTMLEVRSALVSLQDEIVTLSRGLEQRRSESDR